MDRVTQIIMYGTRFWKPLVIATIIVNVIYYIVGNWEWLFAVNSCMTLNKLVRGKLGTCLATPAADISCQEMQHGYSFGWCNDPDNNGPMPGTKDGPYGATCQNWSWKKSECPPVQCSGKYPYGIAGQQPFQKWGWCADPGVNRAMKGKMCGPDPSEGTCNNWIWDPSQCPKTCQKPKPKQKALKPKSIDDKECGTVCGNVGGKRIACPPKCITKKKTDKCSNLCGLVNGVWINCPPPPCTASSADKCICPNRL